MHDEQNRGVDVAARATPTNTTTAVMRIAATVTPRLVRRKLNGGSQRFTGLGRRLWTARRWHSVHWKPLSCRLATLWQPVHTDLPGLRCAAWYLPLWHVRQLLTALLTREACSALV